MASSAAARIVALDQQTVNRIAAGEVIHRPASALKEMLENSLDAGATSINVLAKGGGLKLLQIQDNGHGIVREDFGKVCERFATSKLREYEDLETIDTFGFRGEALASISHVAHVTITSMTAGAPCAHRATYADGHLAPAAPGEAAEPKPCAGTRGTLIVAEEMFHNVAARRAAMKGAGEEYAMLLKVVQSYAIDNPGVSLSCRKGVDGGADLATQRDHAARDVVRLVHGAAVARELVAVDAADAALGLKVSGLVSGPSYSAKRLTFLLFINKRLVESSALKRAIDDVYATCLPKGAHPFIYLSLRLPPPSLDVNVHPTKREVKFLEQEAVVAAVQAMLREKLGAAGSGEGSTSANGGANAARSFMTQAVLPGMVAGARDGTKPASGRGGAMGAVEPNGSGGGGTAVMGSHGSSSSSGRSSQQPPDPRKLVRTNATGMAAGELDKYVLRPSSAAAAPAASSAASAAASASPGLAATATAAAEPPAKRARQDEPTLTQPAAASATATASAASSSSAVAMPPARAADNDENAENNGLQLGGGGVEGGVGGGGGGTGTAAAAGPCLLLAPAHSISSQRSVPRDPAPRPWVACELTSIHALLRRVTTHVSRGLQALFSQHTFVGVVDRRYALLQHLTRLFVVHMGIASEAFCYQAVLRQWGNLAKIRLATPASIAELYLLGRAAAAASGEEPSSATAGTEDALMAAVTAPSAAMRARADEAAALLEDKAEMLGEYVSLEIHEGQLHAIPQLVDGYVPPLNGLPRLVVRLVDAVDWTAEQPCFEGLAKELAALYRVDHVGSSSSSNDAQDDAEGASGLRREAACSEAWTIQHVLLPAMRRSYEPPTLHATNGAVVQVASTEQLYKIFERC